MRIDKTTWGALACLLLAWFSLNTLVVDIGRMSQGLRFYELWPVIEQPSRAITGVDRGHGLAKTALALFAVVAALLVFLPVLWKHRLAWLAHLAPLLLLLVCFAALYVKTSAAYFDVTPGAGAIRSRTFGLLNAVTGKL